ncbi:uroporphyrinogen-III synthase [Hydrogenophaga sp.]|uniref:uroporphyrinogen-III synthase n=1 Tax=Hydrogenophaga sp. TaxID=1904254 RepID=UPI0025B85325|nr:uroporphyrinogen-III synthase [Hydrogenophaga sp.]
MAAGALSRPDSVRVSRVVITRPAREAHNWAQALQAQGWSVTVLPLIEIGEPTDPQALAWLDQQRCACWQTDAVMFVSAAAVQHFFAAGVARPPGGEWRTRFWAPGPGTARALTEALHALGVGDDRIDSPRPDSPQFDSEHLWPVIAPQLVPGARVLIVRGHSAGQDDAPPEAAVAGTGRDWLIRRCEAAGAVVQTCVAYERRAPVWSTAEYATAQAAAAPGHLWLFSSSEAVNHLLQLMSSAVWAGAAALATHPRIAEAARAAGFGTVTESRPALADVLRSLESGSRHE